MAKIKNPMTVVQSGGSILPSGYTQMDYLESSGTQYIDTGKWLKQNTAVEIDCAMLTTNPRYAMALGCFGSYGDGSSFAPIVPNGVNSATQWSAFGDSPEASYDFKHITEIRCVVYASLTEVKCGGYTVASFNYSATENPSKTFWIFGGNSTSEYKGHYRIWEYKLFEGGTLIQHLIPAKRDLDDVLGMYDVINNNFYTNDGTGTFTGGALS